MDPNFLNAVHVSFEASGVTAHAKKEADMYLMNLQSTEEGWNICCSLLALPPEAYTQHATHFFWAFQLLVHQITQQCLSSDQMDIAFDGVLRWAGNALTTTQVPLFLFNKSAQVLVVYLQHCAIEKRGQFFELLFDFLQQPSNQQTQMAHFWLRVYQCIDERIVCRDVPRTPSEHARDNSVKDTMRECCIARTVVTWHNILSCAHHTNPPLARLCLEVIEPYVEWIDVSYLSTKNWTDMLYHFLTLPELRGPASDIIYQLVLKKMPHAAKYKLLFELELMNALPHIANEAVRAVRGEPPRQNNGETVETETLGGRESITDDTFGVENEYFPDKITDLIVCVGLQIGNMIEASHGGTFDKKHSASALNNAVDDRVMHGTEPSLASLCGPRSGFVTPIHLDEVSAMLYHIIHKALIPLYSSSEELAERSYELLHRYLLLEKRKEITVRMDTRDFTVLLEAVYEQCLLSTTISAVDTLGGNDRNPAPNSSTNTSLCSVSAGPTTVFTSTERRKRMFNLIRSLVELEPVACFSMLNTRFVSIRQKSSDAWTLREAEGVLRVAFEVVERVKTDKNMYPNAQELLTHVLMIPFLDHWSVLVHVTLFEVLERYTFLITTNAQALKSPDPVVSHSIDLYGTEQLSLHSVLDKLFQCFLGHPHGVLHPNTKNTGKVACLSGTMTTTSISHTPTTALQTSQVSVTVNAEENPRGRICYLFSRVCFTLRHVLQHSDGTMRRLMDAFQGVTATFLADPSIQTEDVAALAEGFGLIFCSQGPYLEMLSNAVMLVCSQGRHSLLTLQGEGFTPGTVPSLDEEVCNARKTNIGPVLGFLTGITRAMASQCSTNNPSSSINRLLCHNIATYVITDILEAAHANYYLRDKILSFLQQYVNCVTTESVGKLSSVIPRMILTTNVVELSKIIRFLGQIVQRTKAHALELTNENMPLIMEAIQRYVSPECTNIEHVHTQDEYKPSLDILRQYFQFLFFVFQTTALAHAMAPDALHQHVSFLAHGAYTHPDFEVSRICLQTLVQIVNHREDIPLQSCEDIARAVILQLLAPHFNTYDGRCYVIILDIVTILYKLLLSSNYGITVFNALTANIPSTDLRDQLNEALRGATNHYNARERVMSVLHAYRNGLNAVSEGTAAVQFIANSEELSMTPRSKRAHYNNA